MTDVSVVEWVMVAAIAIMLILIVSLRVALAGLQLQVRQLQKALEDKPMRASDADEETRKESAFDQFLAEDSERLALSKSEQFAAYREWRKEKGMNWSSREVS